MNILELFSGTQSISEAFRKKGHKTFTVDNNNYFNYITDWNIDIKKITANDIKEKFTTPDIIWASPPCTTFSVASIGHHWKGGYRAYKPKTKQAKQSQKLVKHTLNIINELNPKYYFIENPRGLLRKMEFMYPYKRYTITYCQYGDDRMKPTDIWTNHPSPQFKTPCSNGDNCHISAPRGSKTGTQGLKNSIERAKIPNELCNHIAKISELSREKAENRKKQLTFNFERR